MSKRLKRNFRSVNLEADFGNPDNLSEVILTESFKRVVADTLRVFQDGQQAAFTWTGPYGAGKSTMLLVLAHLLSQTFSPKTNAEKKFSSSISREFSDLIAPGWRVVTITSGTEGIRETIAQKLADTSSTKASQKVNNKRLLKDIKTASNEAPLAILVDEFGKALEAAAHSNTSELYFIQELAELAARSERRILFIGTLHQSFSAYAPTNNEKALKEWAKISGRLSNLILAPSAKEQAILLSKAIDAKAAPDDYSLVAQQASNQFGSSTEQKSNFITGCYPLSPLLATIVGPLFRRSFAQGQRSIFAFLQSDETGSFRHFLRHRQEQDLYGFLELFGYLKTNFDYALSSSTDSSEWAAICFSYVRATDLDLPKEQIELVLGIGFVDWLQSESFIKTDNHVLQLLGPKYQGALDEHLSTLKDKSLIIYRQHQDKYALFAGSDFNIDDAVAHHKDISRGAFSTTLSNLTAPLLVPGKHYHTTGTSRPFKQVYISIAELSKIVKMVSPTAFIIFHLVADNERTFNEFENEIQEIIKLSKQCPFLIAYSPESQDLAIAVSELAALKSILASNEDVNNDVVARAEIRKRIEMHEGAIHSAQMNLLHTSTWWGQCSLGLNLSRSEVGQLLSKSADNYFPSTPVIKSELLNRDKPSSAAASARNMLMQALLDKPEQENLGFQGLPPEAALYRIFLHSNKLHEPKAVSGKHFKTSSATNPNLSKMFQAAEQLLKEKPGAEVTMASVYGLWEDKPFGVKKGPLPLFGLVFVLANWDQIGFYRNGIFCTALTQADYEALIKSPNNIVIKYIDQSNERAAVMEMISQGLNYVGHTPVENTSSAIELARALVSFFDGLPEWSKRTSRVSNTCQKLSAILANANDPERLLFKDIPTIVKEHKANGADNPLGELLAEPVNAYKQLLADFHATILRGLKIAKTEPVQKIKQTLHDVTEKTGDFTIDALIARLKSYDGSDSSLEGIIALSCSKPPMMWRDDVMTQATLNLSKMCQQIFDFSLHHKETANGSFTFIDSSSSEDMTTTTILLDPKNQKDVEALIQKIEQTYVKQGKEASIVQQALARLLKKYCD